MIFSYSLELEDFLTFQLFTASKSERVKRKRKGSRVFVPLVYIMFAVLFAIQHNYIALIAILSIAIAWYFLYPKWEQHRYKKQFSASILENFGSALGRVGSIEFVNQEIIAKDDGQEARVKWDEVLEVNRISNYLMIKLKNGHSFIFPERKIANWAELESMIHTVTQSKGIPIHTEMDWKWM